jgi:ABC-type bacteriocin/lantibiotic exporter with double-glycine peptidase domain
VYYLASMETLAGSAKAAGARFSTGDFIAFNAALFSLVGGLYALLTTAMDLVRLMPVWERARPIVETLPEAGGRRNERHDPLGGIEILNLGFRYGGGPEVLREVNFTAAPGAFVAIVGASGSGKSTLMRLLLGFEQPTAGSICYDGHDLAGLDVRFLRSRIGTVLQGWRLWPGDIFSNIAASSNLPIDAAREAARLSGLEADIEAMPMGMYTVVGDGDSTLSGGQRQRVLIARAIVNRPRILLLDEATSALDNVSQAAVQEGLANLDCTRLVIAHRLSTIRAADSIIVLDQGRIVQKGMFDELAAAPGVFADLLQRQIV